MFVYEFENSTDLFLSFMQIFMYLYVYVRLYIRICAYTNMHALKYIIYRSLIT